MRAVTLVTLAAIMAAAVTAKKPVELHEVERYSFDEYVKDYKKTYKQGTEEYVKRRAVFEDKKKRVLLHNADPVASRNYKKGINHLSDKSDEEFQRRLGGRPRAMTATRESLKRSKYYKEHLKSGLPIPDSVDWRLRLPSIFTGIKDQGDCGSCWAHASTENLESHWALRTGQLFTLSQQEITACTPNPDQCGGTGGCLGSIAELAYKYVADAGIAQEWTYPYTAYTGTTGTCISNFTQTDVTVTGYTAVTPNDQDAVMDAIAFNGPLAINVDASEWSDYAGGIYDGCNYAKNISIDHVVQLVGYGYDAGLGKSYWIVRNSWSPAWGELGYIRLIRNAVPECGWDVDPQDGTACKGSPPQLHVCGQCGILFDTVYPTVEQQS
jgi:cathepsin L